VFVCALDGRWTMIQTSPNISRPQSGLGSPFLGFKNKTHARTTRQDSRCLFNNSMGESTNICYNIA
jgi:hypothetical protein